MRLPAHLVDYMAMEITRVAVHVEHFDEEATVKMCIDLFVSVCRYLGIEQSHACIDKYGVVDGNFCKEKIITLLHKMIQHGLEFRSAGDIQRMFLEKVQFSAQTVKSGGGGYAYYGRSMSRADTPPPKINTNNNVEELPDGVSPEPRHGPQQQQQQYQQPPITPTPSAPHTMDFAIHVTTSARSMIDTHDAIWAATLGDVLAVTALLPQLVFPKENFEVMRAVLLFFGREMREAAYTVGTHDLRVDRIDRAYQSSKKPLPRHFAIQLRQGFVTPTDYLLTLLYLHKDLCAHVTFVETAMLADVATTKDSFDKLCRGECSLMIKGLTFKVKAGPASQNVKKENRQDDSEADAPKGKKAVGKNSVSGN